MGGEAGKDLGNPAAGGAAADAGVSWKAEPAGPELAARLTALASASRHGHGVVEEAEVGVWESAEDCGLPSPGRGAGSGRARVWH